MLRFDPFREFSRAAEELLGESARRPGWMPMDVYRSGDHYVLNVDLPGVDPGSIDVQAHGGVLTLRAERSTPEGDSRQWLVRERPAGVFSRQLMLGNDVDVGGINATYDGGVLTVTLPVAEAAKPRRITVASAERHDRVIEGAQRDRGDDAPKAVTAGTH